MKGFFIKKAFFDGWDNLIGMVVLNLIYIALFLGSVSAVQLIGDMTSLAYVLLLVIVFVGSLCMGAVANATYEWSDYKSSTFAAFKEGFVRNIRHSILYFFLQIFQFFMITIIIPFYASGQNAVTIIIMVVLFWVEIVLLLSLPFRLRSGLFVMMRHSIRLRLWFPRPNRILPRGSRHVFRQRLR